MKRIRCGALCITIELVRMPCPKNRTPFSSVPSVTPVATNVIGIARRQLVRRIDALEVRDAHRAAPRFVLRLRHDQAPVDFAAEAAHRRRGQHAFRRAARAHHRVHARSVHRRRDAGRQIAVANQPDARAGGANVADELLVPRRARAPSRPDLRSCDRATWRSTAGSASPAGRGSRRAWRAGRRPASPCTGRARAAARRGSPPPAPPSRSARRSRTGSCPPADRRRCRPSAGRLTPFAPRPTRSPMYSIGASSRSPSPMTIVPSMRTSSSVRRIASTAAWSDPSRSPWPIVCAHAMPACSTTRSSSSDRSGGGRPADRLRLSSA